MTDGDSSLVHFNSSPIGKSNYSGLHWGPAKNMLILNVIEHSLASDNCQISKHLTVEGRIRL
jgi:hypothetical protein